MQERIRQMQSEVDAERAALADLEAKVTDRYIREVLLKRATHSLDDVEAMLGYASQSSPIMWLAGAEFFFHIAELQRKGVQDIVEKFGANAVSIGG
jgi:hypothetical protein